MKALVLGGAGEVGRHVVETTSKIHTISQIVIGERDLESATALAASCGDKVVARAVDITDERALHDALRECDAVVSCVGPYYRFGTHVLRAAIRAGCHYVDVCDDWEPTLDMLSLDEPARQAGITAVIGMGASPGVSNLLAAAAHAALDRVHTLHTLWGIGELDGPDPTEDEKTSAAALEHWLLQATGHIRVCANRALTDARPLQACRLRIPSVGEVTCHSLGHPEPVTLLRTYPELRDSLNLMNLPGSIINALRDTANELDAGQLDMPGAVARLRDRLGEGNALSAAMGGLRFVLGVLAESIAGVKYAPELCALAAGQRSGGAARAGAWLDGYLPGGTGGSTGIPAAVALDLIAQGEIHRRGVFAPEAGIDPEQYFHHLEPHAVRPQAAGDSPLLTVVVENR